MFWVLASGFFFRVSFAEAGGFARVGAGVFLGRAADRGRTLENLAFLFPGQGSQAVGMGRDLCGAFPAARRVFEEVDDALSESLSRLIFEGPAEALDQTENTQPALMAVSLAVMRVLEDELGDALRVSFAAGHSLGEYSALASFGVFGAGVAARLLRLRGRAMQEAVPAGEGGMSAVLGLPWSDVEEVARDAGAAASAERDELRICVPANDNADGQVVISGHTDALGIAERLADERGARRCVRLRVSAPFHSPLMGLAGEVMGRELGGVDFGELRVPVVSNVLAEAVGGAGDFRDLLVRQVTAPVRWRESMLFLGGGGVDFLVEVGAGRVLCGLAKRTVPGVASMSVSTPQDVQDFLSLY